MSASSEPGSSGPPRFTLRDASPADVPEIVAMIRELALYEKLAHLCVTTDTDLERHLFGPGKFAEVIVASENDVAVGFALFFHNFSTFLGRPGLYLEDLFVRPHARRRGYGRAMLIRLAKIAIERDCGRFEWSVLDWNAPAIAFYESLGATVMPDWRITRVTGPALGRLAALAHSMPTGG